jgi:hypothetical protein
MAAVRDEYAVNRADSKMFGVLDVGTDMEGCRFSLGVRNSHGMSIRLAMTVVSRAFVCDITDFPGDVQPVPAKHSTAELPKASLLRRRGLVAHYRYDPSGS